ncbi:MAG: protein BatD [Opitutae bacterium]|nr:protein BatD [Opitutae bacterium]
MLGPWLFLLAAVPVHAQSVRWDPPGGQLGFNQVSDLSLTFDNCEPDGDPRLPAVNGLVFGPPSQSSQTSIVNFKVSKTFSFVFPVRPTKRSALTIPAFDVATDKGRLRVPAATYTVGDATVGNTTVAVKDVTAARLETPKRSYWAGELIPVTFTLDVRRRLFYQFGPGATWQPAPFTAEDWSKPDLAEALVRGEPRAVLTQTTRVLGREPGTFTLPPASAVAVLAVPNGGFSLFGGTTAEPVQVSSEPLTVTLDPLPPAPADFSKAVGQFTLVSKIVPTTAAPGEPITWTLELAGTGNWPDLAGLPQREVSSDFQVVQPKSKRTMKDGSLFEGTLAEDVVLVPTKPGRYSLGPVKFTYFDPKTGTYKTLSSEAVTVNVTAAAAPPAPAAATGPVQFSLNGATPPSSAPAAATVNAVPPVPPDRLPRDPLPGRATGFAPLRGDTLWLVASIPAAALTLLAWLVLAALRSRHRDPQRLRREACAALAKTLAELRTASAQQTVGAALRRDVLSESRHKAAPTASPAEAPEARQLTSSQLLQQWQIHSAALWEISHAAPGAPRLQAAVAAHSSEASAAWTKLWEEADRTQFGPDTPLPPDWVARAEAALAAVQVPSWPVFSLFAPRNFLPFLFSVFLLSALSPQLSAMGADSATEHYKHAEFPAAEQGWRAAVAAAPTDWVAQHNLGLALAQQERWAEATVHWTSAFLLAPRADATRWDLALGLQRSGLAPPELVDFSRGEGRFALARSASPGEWQLALVAAALLIAVALIVLLLRGYGRIGAWARPVALATMLLAVLLAAAATFSLHTYGQLADPDVALVWKPSTLRSIPTDADTAQKTSPLSAGSLAVADKTFLGWSRLTFPGGQQGWVRTEDLLKLYR